MPIRFPFSEFADIAANGAVGIAQEVATAGKQVYCTLVQNSPFSVMYNNPLTSPIVRRALGDFCGQPPPVTPPPPYTGGQCITQYTLRVTCMYTNRFQSGTFTQSINLATVTGAITALSYFSTNSGQVINVQVYRNNGINPTVYQWNLGSSNTLVQNTVGYQLIRKDGLPDNCGDIPGGWYPTTPPPDVNNTTNINTNVTNQAGDTNSYSVTINRDRNNYINFPPVIVVNGITVSVDATGISIGEVNINKRSGGDTGSEDDINNTDTDEPVPTEELPPEEIPEEVIEKEVEKLIGISIDIGSIPTNAKIVSGNGGPNLIYAGWTQFKKGDNYYPRIYIDFVKTFFPAPEGCTGYAVTLKKGYSGEVKELIAKQ